VVFPSGSFEEDLSLKPTLPTGNRNPAFYSTIKIERAD